LKARGVVNVEIVEGRFYVAEKNKTSAIIARSPRGNAQTRKLTVHYLDLGPERGNAEGNGVEN
jgi:hypothetical protein